MSAWGSTSARLCPSVPCPDSPALHGLQPMAAALRHRHCPCPVPLLTCKPPPQLALAEQARGPAVLEQLSRALLARQAPCLCCWHHLTRFNLKTLLKRVKPTKNTSTQRVPSAQRKTCYSVVGHRHSAAHRASGQRLPAPHRCSGFQQQHNTPRHRAGPGGQGSSVQRWSSHEPGEEEEQSKAAFSPRKKTFPQLPLRFGRLQGHRAPTHSRPHCLLCPGTQEQGGQACCRLGTTAAPAALNTAGHGAKSAR